MTTEEQKLNKDEETLVAYLDGELSEAEIIEVEKRPVSYTHLTLPTICSV